LLVIEIRGLHYLQELTNDLCAKHFNRDAII
jgi:hypothetical protein